jgi:hypothetical protein
MPVVTAAVEATLTCLVGLGIPAERGVFRAEAEVAVALAQSQEPGE